MAREAIERLRSDVGLFGHPRRGRVRTLLANALQDEDALAEQIQRAIQRHNTEVRMRRAMDGVPPNRRTLAFQFSFNDSALRVTVANRRRPRAE